MSQSHELLARRRSSTAAGRMIDPRFGDTASRRTRIEIIGNDNGKDVRDTNRLLQESSYMRQGNLALDTNQFNLILVRKYTSEIC